MAYDFTKSLEFSQLTSDQLKKRLQFHENDRGTETTEQEMRRMYLVQEFAAELQSRGIDPWAE